MLRGERRGLPEIAVHTFRSNALRTFVAIDAAQRSGVPRFLCASSINAFGTFFWRLSGKPAPYGTLPLDERLRPVPEDPYSLRKLVRDPTSVLSSATSALNCAMSSVAARRSAASAEPPWKLPSQGALRGRTIAVQ